MPDTLYKAIVVQKDNHEIEFVSHHPEVFIESPGPTATFLNSVAELDLYMAGQLPNQRTVPMKYTRRWLEDLKRSDWAKDVRFEEVDLA